MAAALGMLKLSLLLNLLSNANLNLWPKNVGIFPPTCSHIECPDYQVIHAGDGFEIRSYNSSVWMSTAPLPDISLVEATRTGFLLLFDYIQGNNKYEEKIEMTGPVITEISPSDGPFCESSFTVSFYVPKANQANPPPAVGLHIQEWKPTYVAVRQFGGFVSNFNVGEEAAALQASIVDTVWSAAIERSHGADSATSYVVAQYNSPFEFDNRVNEIWIPFDIENGLVM
ncbi:heme-binding protein 2 [Tripterygium wilfordii]|uniref:Heme-binding protein 2 n=1 Tax=Tripterygium wilfordii TaxID=458696 RepID=A0A7J7C9H8_TRIWF|nr:heme-binding protein 2 [Tripterygium wilfordii]KAF5730788.1 heme-binding protein 2 [Tripterygium wilfordii]